MAKKKSGTSGDSNIRQCASIRSKKIPDQQCTFSAISGEFCMRHSKNQIRFQKSGIPEQEQEQEPVPVKVAAVETVFAATATATAAVEEIKKKKVVKKKE